MAQSDIDEETRGSFLNYNPKTRLLAPPNISDIAPRSPARQCRVGLGCGGQLPFEVRARDQIRLNDLPSSSANRLAKIGAVKLGSSSLIER